MLGIGVTIFGAIAASATYMALQTTFGDPSWHVSTGGTVLTWIAMAFAWVGAVSLLRRRYVFAAIGSWVAVFGTMWLGSLVLVAVAFAIALTVVMVINAERDPRYPAEHGS